MFKKKTQKILIPKGTINPNEDTLIEIPSELKNKPVIVAQKGYNEKSISIETTTKNVEFEGDKYSELEDSSRRIQIVKERGRSSPNQYPTPSVGNRCCLVGASLNDDMDNDVFDKSFENLQRAKQDLENTAYLTTTGGSLSDTICRNDSITGASDPLKKPKRTSLSTSTSCDQSFQPSTSRNEVDTPQFRNEADLSCSRTSEQDQDFLPLFNSTQRSSPNSKSQLKDFGNNSFPDLDDEDDRVVSLKEDKNRSAACLKPACPSSSKPQFQENRRVQGRAFANDTIESERSLPQSPKCCENKHDRSPQMTLPTPKASCPSRSRRSTDTSPERLKQMYKCSDNDVDNVYVEQLKRQFDEARRKLEDAIVLASMSLKQLKSSKKYSTMLRSSLSGSSSCKAASICDSVPEKDISFLPRCCSKPSCVGFTAGANKGEYRSFKEDSFPKADFSFPSDTYKDSEVYKNILTKPPTDFQSTKCPAQRDTDNPYPFLKFPNPEKPTPRSYRVSKGINTQTERRYYPAKSLKIEVQSGSATSKCSSGCSKGKANDGSTTRFVKEPRANFTDSDTLLGKNSSMLM